MSIVKIINLPKITDPRGNLTFLEYPDQIPFKIKRVFWTYNIPGGEKRGGHAFKTQKEIIIALSGSFNVNIVDVNGNKTKFYLNRSYEALYLPPNTWRNIDNFSTNSLSLHISDQIFKESDYIRNFKEFANYVKRSK